MIIDSIKLHIKKSRNGKVKMYSTVRTKYNIDKDHVERRVPKYENHKLRERKVKKRVFTFLSLNL